VRILQQLRRFLRLFRKTPEIQSIRSPQLRPRQELSPNLPRLPLKRSLSVEVGLQELKTNNPESKSQGL
jgi:hypothetical protein